MLNIDAISVKIEKRWVSVANPSLPTPGIAGYFTPEDCFTLVNEGFADYMGPQTEKWVRSSMLMSKSRDECRWANLKLTDAGKKIFWQPS